MSLCLGGLEKDKNGDYYYSCLCLNLRKELYSRLPGEDLTINNIEASLRGATQLRTDRNVPKEVVEIISKLILSYNGNNSLALSRVNGFLTFIGIHSKNLVENPGVKDGMFDSIEDMLSKLKINQDDYVNKTY